MTGTYDVLLARLASAFDAIVPGADPVLRPSERSDYQANGVMALAKSLGVAPREMAQRVLAELDLAGVADVEVAGPGFLNLTLTAGFLDAQLSALVDDDRLGVGRV